MSEPFLAEIRIFGFNFAPRGWALCDGQILPINQNQSLYSLLGTTYGGDGRTTFALPDLRGRVPIHEGPGHTLGQRSGEETHLLNDAELAHSHGLQASGDGATSGSPTDPAASLANRPRRTPSFYTTPGSMQVDMHPDTVEGYGSSRQPHNNMQPFLAVNFGIALQGLFPPRN